MHSPPEPWNSCKPGSTPDTQPLEMEAAPNEPASEGDTYLSMVTRKDGSTEACQQELSRSLLPGMTHEFKIDLAQSDNMKSASAWYDRKYDSPVRLEVWVGNDFSSYCDKDSLLWRSPVITHSQWKTYTFTTDTLRPEHRYLILEVKHATDTPDFGNILIDNIRLNTRCNIFFPNAFSPNGDGINDRFHPVTHCRNLSGTLEIYNQWQGKIFSTQNVMKGWNGTFNGQLVPEDMYVWTFSYKAVDSNAVKKRHISGFLYRK